MKSNTINTIVFVLIAIAFSNTSLRAQSNSGCNLCPPGSETFVDCTKPHDMFEVFVCLSADSIEPSFLRHKDVVIHKKVTFVLPNKPSMKAIIDFDDGKGGIAMSCSDQKKTIFYTTAGTKKLLYLLKKQVNPFTNSQLASGFPFMQIIVKDSPNKYTLFDKQIHIDTLSTNNFGVPATIALPTAGLSKPAVADAYLKYARTFAADGTEGAPDGKLDRLLIFVDGIDFGGEILADGKNPDGSDRIVRHGSTGWDVFARGLDESKLEAGQVETFGQYPTNFRDLLDKDKGNYDVMFLDFANGATFMQKNAAVLEKLLKDLQNDKLYPDVEEIVVIGASMGGQISRYALTKMEKDGTKHCVEHWVSFDSPNAGANIALGVQAAALYNADVNGDPSGWLALNSPAARQLLNQPLQSAIGSGQVTLVLHKLAAKFSSTALFPKADNYALRNDFMTQVNTNGGYPTNARNLAVACGSGLGTPQDGLSAKGGDYLWQGSVITRLTTNLQALGHKKPIVVATFGASTVSGTSSNFTPRKIYPDGVIGDPQNRLFTYFKPLETSSATDKLTGPISNNYEWFYLNNNYQLPPTDGAPGGYRDDLIFTIKKYAWPELYNATQTGLQQFVLDAVETNLKMKTAFISTASAIDLNTTNLFEDIKNSKLSNIANKRTPFDDYFAPDVNLSHVELDANKAIVTYLLEQFQKFGKVLPTRFTAQYEGGVYNFGLERNRLGNVIIENGATILINNGGANTNFINSTTKKEDYGKFPNFSVSTTDCNPVIVNGGGSLILGSTQNKRSGELKINRNTEVAVSYAGNLKLEQNSTINVLGILRLYAGANVNLADSTKIVVAKGGRLVLNGNVAFDLVSKSARIVIQDGGTLEANGNIKVNGDGFIEFEKGNIFYADTKKVKTIQISGNKKNKRFIQVDKYATVTINNVSVLFSTGTINYDPYSSIAIKNAGYVHINNISATGKNSFEKAFDLQSCDGNVDVTNSDFYKLGKGFWVRDKLKGTFETTNCSFTNCDFGISADANGDRGNYKINEYTTFIRNGIGCDFRNQNGNIELQNVTLLDNNFGLNLFNTTNIVNVKSSTFGKNHSAGLLTYGVKALVVSNSTFYEHNDESHDKYIPFAAEFGLDQFKYNAELCWKAPSFGIFNAFESNVVLKYGTTFTDNNFAVYKTDQNYQKKHDPLVIDCTTFDNNNYAVKGINWEIQADASSTKLVKYKTSVSSNNFLQGSEKNKLFDVCYAGNINKPINILMRENYWDTENNGPGNNPDSITISFKEECYSSDASACQHCSALGNCIDYDISDYLKDPNRECEPPMPPGANDRGDEFINVPTDGICYTHVNGGYAGDKTPIHAQYRYAYYGLFNPKNTISDVMESFTRVAIIPLKKEDKSVCAQYIRVARAFTGYDPDNIGELEIGKVQQKAPIVASIYPNPADNMLQVNYDKGAFTVNVLDLKGQVIYKNEAEYGLEINTSTWQSGVYQVSITDKTTGNQSVKKVVIMRGN